MKLLEVIELRSVGVNQIKLKGQLKSLIEDLIKVEEVQKVKIYNRLKVDTDFSVHIIHETEGANFSGSPLGLCLADLLKEYGLVNHTIWAERNS